MDLNKELKLMIYESSLDDCDKEDLLTIVESTDDEEVLSDVFDILEAGKEEATDGIDIHTPEGQAEYLIKRMNEKGAGLRKKTKIEQVISQRLKNMKDKSAIHESVLEAYKEGILTESEVLELFEASKAEIDYMASQGSFERFNKNTNAMLKNVDKIISGEYKERKLSKDEKRKRDLKEGYKLLHKDENV